MFTNDALWFSAWISLEVKDFDAAQEFAAKSMKISAEEHFFLFEAMSRAFYGRVLSKEGKHQEAIDCIQKGLRFYTMSGMVAGKIIWLEALAETYCAAKQIQEGLEAISQAEQFQQETGENRQKSSLQRIKGDLYLQEENELAAEQTYLNAIQTAQEQSAKMLELEAVKRLARLWQQQGKSEQAREKLQAVYGWFTEGFNTPMLIEARKLLDELTS